MLEYLKRGISALNAGSGISVNLKKFLYHAGDAVSRFYRSIKLIFKGKSVQAAQRLDISGSMLPEFHDDTFFRR